MVSKTKQDQMRQLTPEPVTCLGALLGGATDEAAATAAGVVRSTAARWKASDALFVATLNAELQRAWDGQRDRLAMMREKALGVV